MPNIDELIAMEVNQKLIGMGTSVYWSSSPVVGGYANTYWCANSSFADDAVKTQPYNIWCIKR